MENLFKNRLKEIRKDKQLTQKAVATALETYQQNVAEWESGKTTPNMFTIIELAKFLNVTTGQLLGTEEY